MRYTVQVEQFLDGFYVIKFYSTTTRRSKNKFNILTHQYLAAPILETVMKIALEIYSKDNNASFGFVGERIITKTEEESASNTKRFRLYKKLVQNFFPGKKVFKHYQNIEKSAYVIVNNCHSNHGEYASRLMGVLEELYPEFTFVSLTEIGS